MTTALHDRHERQLKRWNITQEQWDAVWEYQKGRCHACVKPFSLSRLPCVDHDHLTGLWRGLLCTDCNYAIGMRHDDVAWFTNVASYLTLPITTRLHITHYVPGSIGEDRARR